MKKTIHLQVLIFLFFLIPTQNFSQGFVWSNQVELLELGTVASLGWRTWEVEKDANGNTYMVGNFVGTQKFGDSTLMSNGLVIPNNPILRNDDAFIAKYSPDGAFIWVHTFPSSFGSYLYDIEIDLSGNIYVLFSFFDDISIQGTQVSGDEGIVLAKLNADLELQWHQSIIGISTGILSPGNIALSDDDVFMTATATSEVMMGNAILNPNQRSFVISLDNENGNINWTDETGFESGELATDSNGNLYLTTNVNFLADPIVIGGTTIISDYGAVMVFIKYDDEGNLVWMKTSGNGETYSNNVKGVSVNPTNGDIYYVGKWGNTLNIDGIEITENTAFTAKLMFLTKFNAAGEIQWIKSSNAPDPSPNVFLANISQVKIDVTPDGGTIVGGQYVNGEMSLGEGINEIPFGFDGLGFIAKYAADGELEWAQKLRCLTIDCELTLGGIESVGNNQVVFTGNFSDIFDLSDVTLNAVVPSTVSQSNIYLVKVDGDLMTSNANNITKHLQFQISPNPTNNFVQIKVEDDFPNGQVEVVSVLGDILLRADFQGDTKMLNVSALPSGTYFLKVIGKEMYGIQKFIKQK